WGIAPLLGTSGSSPAHVARSTAPRPSTPVAASGLGGLLPGTAAAASWDDFRHLRIGILDGSSASRSSSALAELKRLALRRGPVRPVGTLRTPDLIVYAQGRRRDARIVANLVGAKTRARAAWHGTQLPATPLVYVLGAR